MNQIRLICKDGDRESLHVKSTLASTFKMDRKTDESIDWADDDVVIIQNKRDDACTVTLKGFTSRGGAATRAIVQSTRQNRSWPVPEGAEQKIILGAGESLSLTSNVWKQPHGRGRTGPPA